MSIKELDRVFITNLFLAWKDERRRREFLEKYARDNGFDFRDPLPWYSLTKEKFLTAKVFFIYKKNYLNYSSVSILIL